MSWLQVLRTVAHLKPIQIWNRVWRKVMAWIVRPATVARMGRVERGEVKVKTAFPAGYRCWDGNVAFAFLNETHEVRERADWNNREWKKLWLYNLHYFDCLRQEGVRDSASARAPTKRMEAWMGEASARAPTGRNGAPTGRKESQALIERWIAENPVGKGNGWEPYPISLRVVNWIKWMMRVGDSAGGGRALPSLFVQMRRLMFTQGGFPPMRF